MLSRLERKRIRQENEEKRQEQDQEEKETLAMVLLEEESVGSVYGDTDENFYQPFSKQRKNSDYILLHVSQNIACTSHVVIAADGYKISRNALNGIIASIIREN